MKKIYARKTAVKLISDIVAQDFIKNNHNQGVAKSQSQVDLGLFFNNELVGVAQFCVPRTSKKKEEYSTELLRLCFKNNVRIVGGASKLIKFYIKTFDPADIFTYQDSTGKNSKVYEHCGMTLVGQEKKKEYLIAPGKTIKTADRNKKEILGLAYAVQYGPDRILGTKLGEKFYSADHPTKPGKRKTNRELFVEELGWHIETTSGDKVYEWINSNRTYYTYKITATDSDKYYYGVSHVKKGNATVVDCLNDGYYGSGGVKFNNWKEKHNDNLKKEILRIFKTKAEAYRNEKKLISDLYKTDKKCLNSREGGVVTGLQYAILNEVTVKECKIHGNVKHQGNSCYKCQNQNSVTIKNCKKHGETKFIGNSCYKCINIKNNVVTYKDCKIHGNTKFVGNKCSKCSASKTVHVGICKKHGEVKFKGNSCCTCQSEKIVNVENCKKHGETSFVGGKCKKCVAAKVFTTEKCEKHGETKFKKGKCVKCSGEKRLIVKNCDVHGETYHFRKSDKCLKCSRNKK